MLKEYRFEKFVNIIRSKCDSIEDDKKVYCRTNEHWMNSVIFQLLYDRAVSKGYKIISRSEKYKEHKDCKYYTAGELKYEIVLLNERNT